MRAAIAMAAKFVLCLIACTMVCTVFWQELIFDKLYNCTDSVPLDFLQPGDWVHHPVTVHQIVLARSMSEPDTIKAGWSMQKLWALWSGMVLASLIISDVFVFVPLGTKRRQGLRSGAVLSLGWFWISHGAKAVKASGRPHPPSSSASGT